MQYKVTINGITPILMNNVAQVLDPGLEINQQIKEITDKKTKDVTQSDRDTLRRLTVKRGLYLNDDGEVTMPPANIRAMIETSARRTKEGPRVRSGMYVYHTEFHYDKDRYGHTVDEICENAVLSVPVVVQRNRVMRHRPMFDLDWSIVSYISCDETLIDLPSLSGWIERGGKHIGVGDWRPEKSGIYGRFEIEDIEEVE